MEFTLLAHLGGKTSGMFGFRSMVLSTNNYLCSSLHAGLIFFFGRWSSSEVAERASLMDMQPLYSQRFLSIDSEQVQPRGSWVRPRSAEPPSGLMNNNKCLSCLSLEMVCYVALLWQ